MNGLKHRNAFALRQAQDERADMGSAVDPMSESRDRQVLTGRSKTASLREIE